MGNNKDFMGQGKSYADDYKEVHIRLQGKQEMLNPELVEEKRRYGYGLAVKYETKNVHTYQHFISIFPWKINGTMFLSDRPNIFTLPGGRLHIFKIIEGGRLKLQWKYMDEKNEI